MVSAGEGSQLWDAQFGVLPSHFWILTGVKNAGVWRWTRPRAHLIHVLPLVPEGTAGMQETLQGKTTLAEQGIPCASFLFVPAAGPTCTVWAYASSKFYCCYLLLKFKLSCYLNHFLNSSKFYLIGSMEGLSLQKNCRSNKMLLQQSRQESEGPWYVGHWDWWDMRHLNWMAEKASSR